MKLLLILGGLVLAVFLADRLLLWLEWRGLIDYRRTYPGRISVGQVGPAFLGIQSLLQPGARHAGEEQTALRTEQDEEGGPDEAGRSADPLPGRPERG
jgi:hypothetical protein